MIEFSSKKQRTGDLPESVERSLKREPMTPIAYQKSPDDEPDAVLLSGLAFKMLANLADKGQSLLAEGKFAELKQTASQSKAEAQEWRRLCETAWAEVEELRGGTPISKDAWQKAESVFEALRNLGSGKT